MAMEMTRQVVGTSGRPSVSTKCKEFVKVVQFMATMSLHGIGTCIPGTSMSIAMARVVKSRVRRTSVKLPGWAKTLSNLIRECRRLIIHFQRYPSFFTIQQKSEFN